MSELLRLQAQLDAMIEREIERSMTIALRGQIPRGSQALIAATRKSIREGIEDLGWVLYHWNKPKGEGAPSGDDDDPQRPAPAAAALP